MSWNFTWAHMDCDATRVDTMEMIMKSWISPHLFRIQLTGTEWGVLRGKRVHVLTSLSLGRPKMWGLMPKIKQMVIMKIAGNEAAALEWAHLLRAGWWQLCLKHSDMLSLTWRGRLRAATTAFTCHAALLNLYGLFFFLIHRVGQWPPTFNY